MMEKSGYEIPRNQITNQINMFPSFKEINLKPANLHLTSRNTSSEAEVFCFSNMIY